MGKSEVRGMHDVVAVEEDVDVERSRAPAEGTFTPRLKLDARDFGKEFLRGKGTFGLKGEIDEIGLICHAVSLGAVYSRKPDSAERPGQLFNREAEVVRAAADVGTQREKYRHSKRLSSRSLFSLGGFSPRWV